MLPDAPVVWWDCDTDECVRDHHWQIWATTTTQVRPLMHNTKVFITIAIIVREMPSTWLTFLGG